jgi:hypothetical protein
MTDISPPSPPIGKGYVKNLEPGKSSLNKRFLPRPLPLDLSGTPAQPLAARRVTFQIPETEKNPKPEQLQNRLDKVTKRRFPTEPPSQNPLNPFDNPPDTVDHLYSLVGKEPKLQFDETKKQYMLEGYDLKQLVLFFEDMQKKIPLISLNKRLPLNKRLDDLKTLSILAQNFASKFSKEAVEVAGKLSNSPQLTPLLNKLIEYKHFFTSLHEECEKNIKELTPLPLS